MPKIPNIIVFVVVAVLILVGVYFYYRSKEASTKAKSAESGNWFTNLLTPSTPAA